MPNANYIAGRAAEYNIVKELRLLGYEAQRSAASHGVFDVYAIRAQDVVLIQSKRGERPSPCEYRSAIEQPVPDGVIKLVVWFPRGQAPRVLYHNRLPDWLDDAAAGTAPRVRWFIGPPPKQQAMTVSEKAITVRAPRRRKSATATEESSVLPGLL